MFSPLISKENKETISIGVVTNTTLACSVGYKKKSMTINRSN
jgi:hypothetical protein